MTLENKNLVSNYSSAKHSWLKSGGEINHLYKIYKQQDLTRLLTKNNIKEKSILVIGNLSNTLIKDEGFKGIGIKLQGDFTNIIINSDHMLVGAAVLDNYFSKFCFQNSITGYEFLYTIPGSIGGNIFMNAGCYNQDIKDKLISVIFFDIRNNKVYEKDIRELQFDYRKGFQKKNTIILYGKFKITYGDKNNIKDRMKEYDKIRNQTQPQKVNCCGSIFKNPVNKSAWKLIKSSIDDSFYNGPIKLSKKHSNFFENEPNISANSIDLFISKIQKKVNDKHKIVLEKELRIID
tara:strand:+ start:13982 stop:14857 length:876 start_codon:yes stop_codon:yes gene_type:complete